MAHGRLVAVSLIIAANLSCAANSTSAAKPPAATPTPASTAPAVGTVAPPSVPVGAAGAPAAAPGVNAPPGGPPRIGPPRRVPFTPEQRAARRDSLSALRTQVLQELMTKIAGSENKRADDEFTNIKLMKDTTAVQLLKTMDYYGKSLSVSCTYCHVGGGKWDEDTKEEKNTTRIMIELVNSINTGGLSKVPPNRNGQTPKISCMTCHRGNTNPGMAMLP
ncbi:MAG TPA: c-type cytochrome [Gemmatimonadales bacterium]|jgi:hypothetical protein